MAARPKWSVAALGGAFVALALTGACDSGPKLECQTAGGASVCLARGTPTRLTSTGLEPGSPVVVSLDGAGGAAAPPPRGMVAGADGRFPPPGTSSGVVIPAGSGSQTVMVTVTPRAGAPTTVTFQR